MTPRRTFTKLAASAAAAALVLGACAHTTTISTEPSGADVWVNDEYRGKSPVTYTTRSGTPENALVKIEKPGYSSITGVSIRKSYRADEYLLLLLPGIFPYFLGSARFEDTYFFPLKQGR